MLRVLNLEDTKMCFILFSVFRFKYFKNIIIRVSMRARTIYALFLQVFQILKWMMAHGQISMNIW